MQIEVPLTLTIEVSDATAAELYLEKAADGTLSTNVQTEFLADLFDDEIPNMIIYGTDKVIKICSKTQENVRKELAARIP